MVAVSVPPHGWFVAQLAGELVDVEVLLPPGASPAQYEPTLAQLRALSEASIYVKVGHPAFPFEAAWLAPMLAQNSKLRIVDASAGVALREGDPHLWLSPQAARSLVEDLAEAVGEVLTDEGDSIRRRAASLEREIDLLELELRELLAPVHGRRFLVMHPAFGYLAREHGLVQLAVEADRKEPDPHQLAALIEQARSAEIRTVFLEPQFDSSGASALSQAIDARLETLDPLAYEWADNLRHIARRLAAESVP